MTISCFRTFLIFIQSYIFNFCIYFKCFFLYLYIIYIYIREYGSTLYVGLARAVSPTNTNFRLTFLLTRLQEALYEDLADQYGHTTPTRNRNVSQLYAISRNVGVILDARITNAGKTPFTRSLVYGVSSILCSFFILTSTQFVLHFSQSHLVYYWHLCLILAKVKLLFFGGFEKNR